MIFVHQVLYPFELISKPGVHKVVAFMESLAVLGVLIKFDCSFLKEVICDLLVLFDILELLICAFDEFLMAYLLIDAIQIATMFSAGVYSFAMLTNIEQIDGCEGDEAKEHCKKTNIVVGCGFWALACMYVYSYQDFLL